MIDDIDPIFIKKFVFPEVGKCINSTTVLKEELR